LSNPGRHRLRRRMKVYPALHPVHFLPGDGHGEVTRRLAPMVPPARPRGQTQAQTQGYGVGAPDRAWLRTFFLMAVPAAAIGYPVARPCRLVPRAALYHQPEPTPRRLTWHGSALRSTLHLQRPRSAPLRSGPLTACHASKRGTVSHTPEPGTPGRDSLPPGRYAPYGDCFKNSFPGNYPPRHRRSPKIL
jgi:hypothetical protein